MFDAWAFDSIRPSDANRDLFGCYLAHYELTIFLPLKTIGQTVFALPWAAVWRKALSMSSLFDYDPRLPKTLIDLQIHVGGAVAPHILFSIAKDQGFKLPVRTYWEFVELVTATPDKVKSLEDYLKIMHLW